MSKTIVINGADFSTNKLDKVSFDVIPCTGISLAESSASVSYEDTYTAVATVTPANTTQEVVWSSNNPNFPVNDGVVSINGVGQAVITATCGQQTASVTLTSTATYDVDDFDSTTSKIVSYYSDFGQLTEANDSSRVAYGRVDENDYHLLWSDAATKLIAQTFCPIMIPVGSTNMTIVYNQTYGTRIGFADLATECSTGNGGVKIVGYDADSSVQAASRTLTIPEDANGFYITIYGGDPSALGITFS